MISHSFASDAHTKATDLAATVSASLSPPHIASACAAVDSFLRKHTPDQHRWFFSITFPALICRLFGFDDSSPPSAPPKRGPSNGWIDVAAMDNDSEIAGRIFSLLSPNGVLLSSISAVDRISLVKYVFPNERLPEWVRYMLQKCDCQVLADLCPLFKDRIKEDSIKGSSYQVQLNVFEYYLFWFAYYPICRGTNNGSELAKVPQTKKFRLENWSYSIPGLSSKRETEKKTKGNLYARLLYAYLHTFVPSQDLNVYQPYRSSLLQYSPGYDNSAIERAEFVINTLIHFWLVNNDFSPFPVGLCKAFGVAFPFRSVLGETPPIYGLGDVIIVLIKYLSLNSHAMIEGSTQNDYVDSPRLRVSGSFDAVKSRDAALSTYSHGSWNMMFQRPLYRYILRTFLFSPVETSMKGASQAFSVWINYIEPWSVSFEEFADLNETLGLSPGNSLNHVPKPSSPGYSSSWQGFVLTNYLYYSSLVMHFIGFAHKFLHTDAEAIIQMVAKVINILTSSVELMDLIKSVDTAFHSKAVDSSRSMLSPLNRCTPVIRQQLQDWEDGLCESDADGSFLHENWNKDLRLFTNGEDGGQHLLQLFLMRAESELQSISGNALSQNLQCLDSLKSQLSKLFGSPFTRALSGSPQTQHHQQQQQQQARDEVFKPRSFGNQIGGGIKYKGDWMKRPASNDEIAWLALFLVTLSSVMNEKLGLNQVEFNQESNGWSYVDVPGPGASVQGPAETLKVVLCSLLCWIAWLGRSILHFMRTHGFRINLRPLASKKVVAVILMFAAFNVVKKALSRWGTD